ncbi:hypothetical protein D3C86_1639820 [compost metagenome]
MAFWISASSCASTCGGVLAGAKMPYQVSTSKSPMPAISTIEGSCGKSGWRAGLVMASARSLPALRWGATTGRLANIIGTWPASTSLSAVASPL